MRRSALHSRPHSAEETLSYLDRAIRDSGARVRYREEVHRIAAEPGGGLRVETNTGVWRAHVVVIAIGILSRPNRPSYPIPHSVKGHVLFDVTSEEIRDKDVIVVGGGDTAAEYCQFLVQEGNRVTLSYRGRELTRPNRINRGERARSPPAAQEIGTPSALPGCPPRARRGEGFGSFSRARPPSARGRSHRLRSRRNDPGELSSVGGDRLRRPRAEAFGFVRDERAGPFLAGDLTAGRKVILAFNTAAAAMRQICEDYGICAVSPRSRQ